jgi:hypothetical protein
MQSQEANIVHEDSDLITSHIETAVNLTTHPSSWDIELSSDILQFLESQGEVRNTSDVCRKLSGLTNELRRSTCQRLEDVITQRIVEVPGIDDTLPLSHYFVS